MIEEDTRHWLLISIETPALAGTLTYTHVHRPTHVQNSHTHKIHTETQKHISIHTNSHEFKMHAWVYVYTPMHIPTVLVQWKDSKAVNWLRPQEITEAGPTMTTQSCWECCWHSGPLTSGFSGHLCRFWLSRSSFPRVPPLHEINYWPAGLSCSIKPTSPSKVW